MALPELPQLWQRYADAMRPLERLTPAEFAAKHRRLHSEYCSERAGEWSNDVFPYQPHVMNCVQEAIETGKRGVVFMKAGQIGGTDCMINGQLWLKVYFPGPQLFLTSTDDVAREFGRERFRNIIPDMAPLLARKIQKREEILSHRFVDGRIQLAGGQSVNKLQSSPYRVVVIDELDSLVENLGGEGDPLKLAEVRMDSFTGQTLMLAYAHPTTKDRGAAKLYYQNSDQRRGFVKHDCGGEFYLQWEHVKPGIDPTDASGYGYFCPCCGAEVDDSERVSMVRKVVYRSTLPPEEAAKRAWIGVHASQLYSPAKSLRSFAQRWVECLGDDHGTRVFYNKVLGEPYEPKVQKVDAMQLRKLVVVKRRANDPEFYMKGQVPPAVRFLTAGQDSRGSELHFAVWGWGLRRGVDNVTSLCGWLIDWGVINRPKSLEFHEHEYHVFDDLIFRRAFTSTAGGRKFNVRMCAMDTSYAPTQIPITKYCQNFPGRAVPCKGASLTPSSASKADYARWGSSLRVKVGEIEQELPNSKPLILNTFMLKTDLFGWYSGAKIVVPDIEKGQVVGQREVNRITFPEDVDDEFIEQSKNESLRRGKRTDELVFGKDGPNHYADCNTYAYGSALQIDPFQKDLTADEYRERRPMIRGGNPVANGDSERDNSTYDPSMG